MQDWNHFLRSIQRKEPISAFILTMGAVDIVMGGVAGYMTLMALGVGTVGVAIALRWRLTQSRRSFTPPEAAPVRYLTDRTSRPALPLLDHSQKSTQ